MDSSKPCSKGKVLYGVTSSQGLDFSKNYTLKCEACLYTYGFNHMLAMNGQWPITTIAMQISQQCQLILINYSLTPNIHCSKMI